MSAELQRHSARLWVEAYLEDLTAHGLYRITATATYLPGIVRLLWAAVFVAAFAFSIQQCSILLAQFQKNEVDVTVDFSFNKKVDFPAVTICNLNALRRQAVLSTRLHEHVNVTVPPTTPAAPTTAAAPTAAPTTPYVPTTDNRLHEANVTRPPTVGAATGPTTPFVEPGTERVPTMPHSRASEQTLQTQTTARPNVAPTTPYDPSGGGRSSPATAGPPGMGGTGTGGGHVTGVPTAPPAGTGTTEKASGDCIIGGVKVPLTLGIPCHILKLLLEKGSSSGSSVNQDGSSSGPTVPPFMPGFIPDDFFQSGTPGGGGTSSDLVLEIADSFDPSGNGSLFEHVLVKQSDFTIRKVDVTTHEVNYQYDEAPVVREEIALLGHQIEDMLIKCEYDNEPCDASNFTRFQNGRYGNCYTFNGDRRTVLSTERVGSTYGLLLELDIEQSLNYIGQLTQAAGIRMVLHQQGEEPFPENDGFDLAPSFKTYVGIRQVVIERRGHPYGDCRVADVDGGLNNDTYGYSKWGCLRACLAEEMVKECGCVDSTFIDTDYRLCHTSLNPAEAACLAQVDKLFKEDVVCQGCEDPCRSIIFRKALSRERWPSQRYEATLFARLQALNRTIHGDLLTARLRDNYLQVVVYFQEFNFQTVTQRPALELVDLLSYIGGTIGLFVGVSLLSIAEFIDIILNLAFFFFRWLYRSACRRLRGEDYSASDKEGKARLDVYY